VDFLLQKDSLLSKDLLSELVDFARVEPCQECCGILIEEGGSLELIKCKNKSSLPQCEFIIDPYIFIENKVKYVYHSHIDCPPFPSKTDKLYSDELCVPFLIYSLSEDSFFLYENVSV
jgi:proteasome lid subunit RPN8/RPN11